MWFGPIAAWVKACRKRHRPLGADSAAYYEAKTPKNVMQITFFAPKPQKRTGVRSCILSFVARPDSGLTFDEYLHRLQAIAIPWSSFLGSQKRDSYCFESSLQDLTPVLFFWAERMARPLRIELAGGLYHVTSRGDRREDIYLDDGDRFLWLDVLGQTCRRFNWTCHAWCQMNNHYHLLVETVEGNLSAGMRHLNGVYTQAVNRKHRRVGHVFQGRYKAILVEKNSHLLELSRYVVLNPVRAGMVEDPGDWVWSSYRNMISKADSPTWSHTDWLLGQFGAVRELAIRSYVDFVRAGIGLPSIWTGLRNQVFLGGEEFVRQALAQSDRLDDAEIPRAQRRAPAQDLARYRDATDSLSKAMYAAFASGGYTMADIARHFGVHYSTVSRAVRCGEEGIEDASGLAAAPHGADGTRAGMSPPCSPTREKP